MASGCTRDVGDAPEDPREMSEYLFVYGTLRRGQPLHRYLTTDKTRLAGEGKIPGRLFDLGEYPGAIPDTKRFSTIRGEVHELFAPDETLEVLDDVEGYDRKRPERSLFERRTARAALDDGRVLTVWVYFYRRPLRQASEIPDGDFARYRTE